MEKKLNPILEVSCEFQFETSFPQEAAYAMLLKCFTDSDSKKEFSIVPQPILNLPLDVRLNDSNLKYIPCYILSNDSLTIGISSFSLMYTIKKDYLGFRSLKQIIEEKNSLIEASVKNIKQIALRYINRIDDSLFNATNLTLSTKNGSSVENKQNFTISIEDRLDENCSTILRLNNLNTSLAGDAEKNKFSVVDIIAFNKQILENFSSVSEVMDKLNGSAENIFKSLMKKDFIKDNYDIKLEW